MRLCRAVSVVGVLWGGSLFEGCGPLEEAAPEGQAPELARVQAAASTSGLSSHFRQWLSANGYEPTYNFARTDLVGGSYGGRASGTKVDIIAHSMGVTLARKAILGGYATDAANGGPYDIGPPLTSSVDTFVGIAGANLGLTSCFQTGPTTPTCGNTNGLYPGVASGAGVTGRSAYLNDLLRQKGFEGTYRYAIFSTVDEIIGYGDVVYGSYTSRLPGQTGEKVYGVAPYGHFGCKDQTSAVQFNMVKNHAIP